MAEFNLDIDKKYFKNIEKTADNIEVVEAKPDMLVELAAFLKTTKNTRFDVLFSVCGTDKLEYFEVVYHLFSTVFNEKLILKVLLDKNNPEIDSLSGIYSAANWHERETFDLLGIKFNNHPELERILLPKDWIGYPLRKNYMNNDERLSWNNR